eukprot:194152_1
MSFLKHLDGKTNSILFIGFNQNQQCFACGTTSGFIIYSTDPFRKLFSRVFNGGIGFIEMLFRCNILALVGGGDNPQYPPNKVMIWDDHQNRCIGELCFRSDVQAVRLRRDKVVVVLEHKIYVYDFSHLKLVDHIETMSNLKGLCVISPDPQNTILICPGLQKGYLRNELYDIKRMNVIQAHAKTVECIALTFNGKYLATTSESSTLVRIWDTATGAQHQEVRISTYCEKITSLQFSPQTSKWLACMTDKGTLRIIKVKIPELEIKKRNTVHSTLSIFTAVLPRFVSPQWPHAHFRIDDFHECVPCIVGFGCNDTTVVIVTGKGVVYKVVFDPIKSGDCSRVNIKSEQLQFNRVLLNGYVRKFEYQNNILIPSDIKQVILHLYPRFTNYGCDIKANML